MQIHYENIDELYMTKDKRFVVKLKLNIKWNGFEFEIQVKDLKRTKEFPKGSNK